MTSTPANCAACQVDRDREPTRGSRTHMYYGSFGRAGRTCTVWDHPRCGGQLLTLYVRLGAAARWTRAGLHCRGCGRSWVSVPKDAP